MQNQTSYRIRTVVDGGNAVNTEPISIPVQLTQTYEAFEILSLKINTGGSYRKYTSNEGIVVGRVCAANTGLGVPNAKVSIFIPRGKTDGDEDYEMYPYKDVGDKNGERVRFNLLPNDSDDACHQVVGTFPTKREVLDNESVRRIFDRYYVYTTVTNESGDYMLANVPVGQHVLHVDIDLSDIGPFLSQKPRDMINNLGYNVNQFDSVTKFKKSNDLDTLSQIYTQNRGVYVYPYWGDNSDDNSDNLRITRCDIDLNYEFQTSAVFMGSVVTDQKGNYVSKNCTPRESAGRMENLITGEGTIEMIRKNRSGKIEQFRIKGDRLIDSNGVWCYSIPMNLDYVTTDEYGNIVPTDNPERGLATRARVRFRITLDDDPNDSAVAKRCRYLVPNNPHVDDEYVDKALTEENWDDVVDYEFGSQTKDESFVDLFINKVYTVKNYIPVLKKNMRQSNREMGGIKAINFYGDNNPFPYNNLSIKLRFAHRFLCVLIKLFINLVGFLNYFIQCIMLPFCALDVFLSGLGHIPLVGYVFKGLREILTRPIVTNVTCVGISEEFCETGTDRFVTYPGCGKSIFSVGCTWDNTLKACAKEQKEKVKKNETPAQCINSRDLLEDCVENMLAQDNDAPNFNFGNDWINGVLYMPLWMRRIRPKRRYLFGLIRLPARDEWCTTDSNARGVKIYQQCSYKRGGKTQDLRYDDGTKTTYHYNIGDARSCGDCIEKTDGIPLQGGVIKKKETIYQDENGNYASVYYYKPAEWYVELGSEGVSEFQEEEDKEGELWRGHMSRLFATDIVLLGSITDCDMNGIPQFFKHLPQTTYNMPTDLLFTDYEFKFKMEVDKESANPAKDSSWVVMDVDFNSESAGADRGYKTSEGGRGGLFYNIGCNSYDTDIVTCINLERICELGVSLDETFNVTNVNDSSGSGDVEIMTDGFISYDEINNFEARSMFATMNSNGLRVKPNKYNGLKEYDFRLSYIENFDGGLNKAMVSEKQGIAAYKNAPLEFVSNDYLHFRMGDKPYYYLGDRFPRWENSFYFYFGLKNGRTAIDKFNELYLAECVTEEEAFPIGIEQRANSWCSFEGEEDGYLHFDLTKVNAAPYTITFNSRSEQGLTYTVWKEGSNAIQQDIINIGYKEGVDDGWNTYVCTVRMDGDGSLSELRMIKNGEYDVVIVDNNGDIYENVIVLDSPRIEFKAVGKNFGVTQEVFDAGVESKPNSERWAQSMGDVTTDQYGDTTDMLDNDDTKGVSYYRSFNDIQNFSYVNGTICIQNPTINGQLAEAFSIKVEDVTEGERFLWENEEGIDALTLADGTQEKALLVCHLRPAWGGYEVRNYNSKVFTKPLAAISENGTVGLAIGIGVDKVEHTYKVTLRQYCYDDEGKEWLPTENISSKNVMVGAPSPYRLKINDVDYEVVKNLGENNGKNNKWLNLGDEGNYLNYFKNSERYKFVKDDERGYYDDNPEMVTVSEKFTQVTNGVNIFDVDIQLKDVNGDVVDIRENVEKGVKYVFTDNADNKVKTIGRENLDVIDYLEPVQLERGKRYYITIPDNEGEEEGFFDELPYYTKKDECKEVGDLWYDGEKVYVLTDVAKRTFELIGEDYTFIANGVNMKTNENACINISDAYIHPITKNIYMLVGYKGGQKVYKCLGAADVREYFEMTNENPSRYKYLGRLEGDGLTTGRKESDVAIGLDDVRYYKDNDKKIEVYVDSQYRLKTRVLQEPVELMNVKGAGTPKQYVITKERVGTHNEIAKMKREELISDVRKAFCILGEGNSHTFSITTDGDNRPINVDVKYDKEKNGDDGRNEIVQVNFTEKKENTYNITDIKIPTITDQYDRDYRGGDKQCTSYVSGNKVATGEGLPYKGTDGNAKVKNPYAVSCVDSREGKIPVEGGQFHFQLLNKAFRFGATMTWSPCKAFDYRGTEEYYMTGLYAGVLLNGIPESRKNNGETFFTESVFGDTALKVMSSPLGEEEAKKDEFAVPTTRFVFTDTVDNGKEQQEGRWRTAFQGFTVFDPSVDVKESKIQEYTYWKPVGTGCQEYVQIGKGGEDVEITDSEGYTPTSEINGNITIKNQIVYDDNGHVTKWAVSETSNAESNVLWIVPLTNDSLYPLRGGNTDLMFHDKLMSDNVRFVDNVTRGTMQNVFKWCRDHTVLPPIIENNHTTKFTLWNIVSGKIDKAFPFVEEETEAGLMNKVCENLQRYFILSINSDNQRTLSPIYDNSEVEIDGIVMAYKSAANGQGAQLKMGVAISSDGGVGGDSYTGTGYMNFHNAQEFNVVVSNSTTQGGTESVETVIELDNLVRESSTRTVGAYHYTEKNYYNGKERVMHLVDVSSNIAGVKKFMECLGISVNSLNDIVNVLSIAGVKNNASTMETEKQIKSLGSKGNYTNLAGAVGKQIDVKVSLTDCTGLKRRVKLKGNGFEKIGDTTIWPNGLIFVKLL